MIDKLEGIMEGGGGGSFGISWMEMMYRIPWTLDPRRYICF